MDLAKLTRFCVVCLIWYDRIELYYFVDCYGSYFGGYLTIFGGYIGDCFSYLCGYLMIPGGYISD
jgi:hypothetical protein